MKKNLLKIAFFNPKGGPGKSTLCRGIAAALMLRGKRMLVVDGDSPQFSSTDWFEARKVELGDRAALHPAGAGRPAGVLHVMPVGSPSRADIEGPWDFVLYDLPGREDSEARAVLVTVDLVFVPLRACHDDTRPLGQALDIIEKAGMARGRQLPAYLIVNQLRRGTRAAKGIDHLGASLPPGVHIMKTQVRALEDWVTACAKGLCPIELPRTGPLRANSEEATEDLVNLTNEFVRVCHHG